MYAELKKNLKPTVLNVIEMRESKCMRVSTMYVYMSRAGKILKKRSEISDFIGCILNKL